MTRFVAVDPAHSLSGIEGDALVVPLDGGWEQAPAVRALAEAVDADLSVRLRALAEEPAGAPALALPLGGARGPDWVVCVGVDEALPRPVAYRQAGMRAAAALGGAGSVAVCADAADASVLIEGLVIGGYAVSDELAAPSVPPDTDRSLIVGRAVNWCRELVNHPSSVLTPRRLADLAVEMARDNGIDGRVWSADDLREERFGGILAVSQGGESPPCMAELRVGNGSGPKIGWSARA